MQSNAVFKLKHASRRLLFRVKFVFNINYLSRHTYEVAPVFVMMEKYMMRKLSKLVGYDNGDGVLCPGKSFIIITTKH